jgi:hypothetical protein
MLIWPEEYFAGPKVARMALSPWFQTMMQWKNANAAGSTGPAASPVTAPAQAQRAVNLQTADNVPRPHGRSYQNGRPDVFAQEWFGRARDRWNGEIGAEFRRQVPIFFDGGTAPQIFLGFSASAGQFENTRANAAHTLSAHFCAIGLLGIEQPEVGPVPYPTANPPPCPHGRPSPNTWFLHHDKELVKRALNGPAPLTEGSWRDLPPQIAVGLSNLHGKRRAVVNALRAAGVPPVGDNDPWTVIMMLMAWSTGPGGVAAHVRHFARAIAGVSGERRWGALIRAAFEAAERGTVPARMPHNHRLNPYYSLIRGMQKVEVGRRLIQATGGNVAFLDDGLGTDRQTVYDKLAHMAYVQQPEDAARRGRVSMVGTQGVTPPPPAGVSPAHNNDDPVTAEADSRQTLAGQQLRTVTRPTGDAARAATATPGVLNTPGQAIDVSTVPREVVAAGLEPENEFQKLFYLYAQYEFFRQRYEARACGASLRFNPYILAGFPAVLFDTQTGELRAQIASRAAPDGAFVAGGAGDGLPAELAALEPSLLPLELLDAAERVSARAVFFRTPAGVLPFRPPPRLAVAAHVDAMSDFQANRGDASALGAGRTLMLASFIGDPQVLAASIEEYPALAQWIPGFLIKKKRPSSG